MEISRRAQTFVRVDSRPESVPRPAHGPALSPRVKPRCGSSAARPPCGVTAAEGRSAALSWKGKPSDVCEPDRAPGAALNWPQKPPVLRYFSGAHRPSAAASQQVLFNRLERQDGVGADAGRAHQLSRLQGLERIQAQAGAADDAQVCGGHPSCFLQSVVTAGGRRTAAECSSRATSAATSGRRGELVANHEQGRFESPQLTVLD